MTAVRENPEKASSGVMMPASTRVTARSSATKSARSISVVIRTMAMVMIASRPRMPGGVSMITVDFDSRSLHHLADDPAGVALCGKEIGERL